MRQSLSHPPATLTASGKPAYLGMWTWLTQRFSAILLLILLPWHWVNPYSRPVRIAVLLVVSMLVRWPLIGLAVGAARGDRFGWRRDRASRCRRRGRGRRFARAGRRRGS